MPDASQHPPPPTLRLLRQMHQAHLFSFSFDLFDNILHRHTPLTLPHMVAKLVGARRGAFCFEHNRVLAAALSACGFQVHLQEARVYNQAVLDATTSAASHCPLTAAATTALWTAQEKAESALERRPLRSHLVLLARAVDDPRWHLCDVGLGDSDPLLPVPIPPALLHPSNNIPATPLNAGPPHDHTLAAYQIVKRPSPAQEAQCHAAGAREFEADPSADPAADPLPSPPALELWVEKPNPRTRAARCWHHLYTFSTVRGLRFDDFVPLNWYCAQQPDFYFVQNLYAARTLPSFRLQLTNTSLEIQRFAANAAGKHNAATEMFVPPAAQTATAALESALDTAGDDSLWDPTSAVLQHVLPSPSGASCTLTRVRIASPRQLRALLATVFGSDLDPASVEQLFAFARRAEDDRRRRKSRKAAQQNINLG